jgi:NADH:ubiquinone oxidoreductase subunit 5 (subunit L)/multisubunit Na+/H+ antiporter MnhA subunit
MAPLIAILGLTLAVVIVIIAILNHRIKMRMIKDGHIDENSIKILSQENSGFKLDTLKWGIILLFGGIGLIVLDYIPHSYDLDSHYNYHDSPLPFGIEIVSLALGFLVYYFIARNMTKNT